MIQRKQMVFCLANTRQRNCVWMLGRCERRVSEKLREGGREEERQRRELWTDPLKKNIRMGITTIKITELTSVWGCVWVIIITGGSVAPTHKGPSLIDALHTIDLLLDHIFILTLFLFYWKHIKLFCVFILITIWYLTVTCLESLSFLKIQYQYL